MPVLANWLKSRPPGSVDLLVTCRLNQPSRQILARPKKSRFAESALEEVGFSEVEEDWRASHWLARLARLAQMTLLERLARLRLMMSLAEAAAAAAESLEEEESLPPCASRI